MKIAEVQVVPIKPREGLLAFASVVIEDSIYLGGIGVYSRPDGSYRLTFPTRKSRINSFPIYHPINKQFTDQITEIVISKYEEVTQTYDRHNNFDSRG